MGTPMRPGAGASVLDGPPPNPTPAAPEGQFQMRGLAGPMPVSSGELPPEILTGIVGAAQTVATTLDAFAQATPDKAAMLSMIKDLLQQYLADLVGAGAGALSPTASGQAPPMGGLDRGIAGAGAI